MKTLCMVLRCGYLAEAAIEDFVVCALHDHPSVQAILEDGKMPLAYELLNKTPVVIWCGIPLEEAHFAPRAAPNDAVSALDCPRLQALPTPWVIPDYKGPPPESPLYTKILPLG